MTGSNAGTRHGHCRRLRTAAGAREAIASAEKYRALATDEDFYHALAVTYERAAREMQLMLDAAERAFAGTAVQEAA